MTSLLKSLVVSVISAILFKLTPPILHYIAIIALLIICINSATWEICEGFTGDS